MIIKRALPGLALFFAAACALAQVAITPENGAAPASTADAKTIVPYDFTPILRRDLHYIHWDPTFNFTAEGGKPFVTIYGKLIEANDPAGLRGEEHDYAKMELTKDAMQDVLRYIDIFTKFADKLKSRNDLAEGEKSYFRVFYGQEPGSYADIIFSHNLQPMLLLSQLIPTEAYSIGTDAFGTNEPTCFDRNPYRFWDYVGLSVDDAKAIQYILTDLKDSQFQEYTARQAKAKSDAEAPAVKPAEPEAPKQPSELENQRDAERLKAESEEQALQQKEIEAKHRQLDSLFEN